MPTHSYYHSFDTGDERMPSAGRSPHLPFRGSASSRLLKSDPNSKRQRLIHVVFQYSTKVGLLALLVSAGILVFFYQTFIVEDGKRQKFPADRTRTRNGEKMDIFETRNNLELGGKRDVIGGRSPDKSIWATNNNNHKINRIPQIVTKDTMENGFLNNNEENNLYKSANLFAGGIPQNTLKFREQVEIVENKVEALDLKIFYREAHPPAGHYTKGEIFLLHGQAFTSANWLEKQTMQTFGAAGYRVVAVDLPGYGQTAGRTLSAKEKPNLIESLIDALHLQRPVLVSPSMSGAYSIPFVMSHAQQLSAFVPIAPVASGDYNSLQYRKNHKIELPELNLEHYPMFQLPTLIVYGERDTSLGILSANNLKALPNGRVVVIPDAGHACYLNNPDAFHTVVLNFMDLVRSNTSGHKPTNL